MALLTLTARGRGTVDTPALDAGSITATPGDGTVTITENVAPSGGTAPYTRNIYRSTTNGVLGSLVEADIAYPYPNAGTNGTPYYYTLRVVDNAAAEADTAQVSATPTAASQVFTSNWSSATGTSDLALYDDARWDNALNTPSDVLTVVAGSGVGFTATTNVLRVTFRGTLGAKLVRTLAVPSQTTYYGRLWVRNDGPNSSNLHPHAWPPGAAFGSTIDYSWGRYSNFPSGGGGWSLPLRVNSSPGGTEWSQGIPASGYVPLDYNTWYRLEWQVIYPTASTYRVYPRIYSLAGTLLYDADTFLAPDSESGGQSLQSWYDASATNRFSIVTSLTDMRTVGLGSEGPSGGSDTGEYYYFAGYALSTTDWIGATVET